MEIRIGNISISKQNISLPPNETWTLITHTLIYLTAVISIFLTPVSIAIVPLTAKIYILTVCANLSAFLQTVKPYTANIQQPNNDKEN